MHMFYGKYSVIKCVAMFNYELQGTHFWLLDVVLTPRTHCLGSAFMVDSQDMSPWRSLRRQLSWRTFFKSNHSNPFENRESVDSVGTRSSMMTSSNENVFRVTGHLCGEFTGHRNNREAGDLRRYHAHYDVIVLHMICRDFIIWQSARIVTSAVANQEIYWLQQHCNWFSDWMLLFGTVRFYLHPSVLLQWASHQISNIAGCACAGNAGNVSPATEIKGNR